MAVLPSGEASRGRNMMNSKNEKDTERIAQIKKRLSKENVISGLLISLALSATIGFFSPFDVYISGQEEFVLGYKTVMLSLLAVTGILQFYLFSLLLLVLMLNESAYKAIRSVYLGLLLAMYSQLMFMNGKMDMLTGDSNDYADPTAYHIVTLIVFVVIALLPLTLFIIKKHKPSARLLSRLKSKHISALSAALIAVQLTGTIGMAAAYGLRDIPADQSLQGFSFGELMKLSSGKNVVVILTDRLDGEWLDREIGKYPEIKDVFEGFTFYKNNISKYTNTFPSVPVMLTGCEFEGQPLGKYLYSAWHNGGSLPELLKKDGYRVNILPDLVSTVRSTSYIDDFTDTVKSVDFPYTINYTGMEGVVPTMMNMSFLKTSPYLVKAFFANSMKRWSADSFFNMNGESEDFTTGSLSVENDIKFYDYLKAHGLNTDGGDKAFTFIHLNFAHGTSDEAARLYPGYSGSGEDADIFETIRGEMEILSEYFRQMKELGIYESSTIVVLGDHGRPPDELDDGSKVLSSPITASLLIKEAGAPSEPMKYDIETPLTNGYFKASMLEYCGLDHSEAGLSYKDVLGGAKTENRIINIYLFQGFRVSPEFVSRYEITGKARDFSNWQLITD